VLYRFIVVDGEIITTSQLVLDGSGPTANAHVMFGWMRDDGADFIGAFPTASTTLTQALLGAGFVDSLIFYRCQSLNICLLYSVSSAVTNQVVQSELFPMPTSGNETWNLYNLTSRIGTDGQFRCGDLSLRSFGIPLLSWR
jgi:hypothetical protein